MRPNNRAERVFPARGRTSVRAGGEPTVPAGGAGVSGGGRDRRGGPLAQKPVLHSPSARSRPPARGSPRTHLPSHSRRGPSKRSVTQPPLSDHDALRGGAPSAAARSVGSPPGDGARVRRCRSGRRAPRAPSRDGVEPRVGFGSIEVTRDRVCADRRHPLCHPPKIPTRLSARRANGVSREVEVP